jgi:hypothetical protein
MIVDSNVVIELLHGAGRRSEKIIDSYVLLASQRPPVINWVIFAETASGSPSLSAYEARIGELGLAIEPFANADAFRASGAFRAYRAKGGPRTTILPDLLIGAQAATRGWPILTSDPDRFESYFPEVELLDPMEF